MWPWWGKKSKGGGRGSLVVEPPKAEAAKRDAVDVVSSDEAAAVKEKQDREERARAAEEQRSKEQEEAKRLKEEEEESRRSKEEEESRRAKRAKEEEEAKRAAAEREEASRREKERHRAEASSSGTSLTGGAGESAASSGTYATDETGSLRGGLVRSQVLVRPRRGGNGTLVLLRCGERVDRTFPGWTRRAFGPDGAYRPYDLNMPAAIPRRGGGALAYEDDSPVTRVGVWGAEGLGQAWRDRGLRPALILCSPALRCVQTAAAFCSRLPADHPPIAVEPGLFEPLGWYANLPEHLPVKALRNCGYPVSEEYGAQLAGGLPLHLLGREREGAAARRIVRCLNSVLEAAAGQLSWDSDR